jgi:hypothetical protein
MTIINSLELVGTPVRRTPCRTRRTTSEQHIESHPAEEFRPENPIHSGEIHGTGWDIESECDATIRTYTAALVVIEDTMTEYTFESIYTHAAVR